MVTINKPKSVTITIRDRSKNKSKSITVYGVELEDVHKKIQLLLSN